MKKIIANAMIALLLLGLVPMSLLDLSVSASAEDDYECTFPEGECYILNYLGWDSDVVIPSEIEGYPVIAIDKNAFSGRSNLKSISIPDSVRFIEEGAFSGCKKLTTITLRGSNQKFCIQNSVLLSKDKTRLLCYPAGRASGAYTIPSTVTSIDPGAFNYRSNLTAVSIPDGVTRIDDYTFYGCSNLSKITIPDSVAYIGNRAFSDTAYENDSTNWQGGTLYCGNHLLGVNPYIYQGSGIFGIKPGTRTIQGGLCENSTSLTTLLIPKSVVGIGTAAFNGCSNLTRVYYEGDRNVYGMDVGSQNSPLWKASHINEVQIEGNHVYSDGCDEKCDICPFVREGHVFDGKCDDTCNVCQKKRTPKSDHAYDNDCDTTCNGCGITREVGPHVYDYLCDVVCNNCAFVRELAIHTYENACATICSACGYVRSKPPHVYDSNEDSYCNLCGHSRVADERFAVRLESNIVYTGEAIIPAAEVYLAGEKLVEGADYAISATNNVNAGDKAQVLVQGIGDYSSHSAEQYFVIAPADLSSGTFGTDPYYYDGKPQTVGGEVTWVKLNGKKLTPNQDYRFYYRNNTAIGTATVIVVGINNYCGSFTDTFSIYEYNNRDYTNYTVTAGKQTTASVIIKSGRLIVTGFEVFLDYTLTDENNRVIKRGTKTPLTTSMTDVDISFADLPEGAYFLDYTLEGYTLQSRYVSGQGYRYVAVRNGSKRYYSVIVYRMAEEQPTYVVTKPTSISIDAPMDVDAYTQILKATAYPSYATLDGIQWSSSNTAVATVDANGILTLHRVGTTVITATAQGRTAQKTITVTAKDLAGRSEIVSYNPATNKAQVNYWGKTLTADTDYTLSYTKKDNLYFVTVRGKGLFKGSVSAVFCADGSLYACPHAYDAVCDVICNNCQAKREGVAHLYDNACDTACNRCGVTRTTTHNYAAATCTAPKTCTVCGATEGEALEHWYLNACDTTCDECGYVRQVPPHPYKGATCTAPKTCTVCGVTEGKALGHDYAAATCVVPSTCERCGVTAGEALGHEYAPATCVAPSTCERCDATAGEKLAHTYKKVITKATLTKDGSSKNVCTACGYTASKVTTIYKASKVSLSKTTYTYNGKVQKPSVVVKDSKGNTISSKHYTVTYASGCKNAGTYKVTIKMKGNYSGTKILTYKIKPIDVSACRVGLSGTSYTYNGKVRKPSVVVKNANGTKLTTSSYTATYASGRKNVGVYKVTVKMKGNYSGTKVLTFTINPVKTTITKVTAVKKALQLTIGKKTTQVTGYEVQYSTSKTFKTYKAKTLTSYKKNTLTLTGLKAKTTYYVRVRTYKTVGGKKYYSGWTTYYVKTK